MKKIISLGLLGATSSLMALGGEFASLYKDPRIMGMGGANVAVGSYSTAVFSNPAGLANIKKEHGFVVDILSVGVTASSGIQTISDDFANVEDGKNGQTETQQIVDILEEYNGDQFNVQSNNYTSVSKNSDLFAWSIGLLAATDAGFAVHGNGSASGSLVEAAGRGYGGVVLGAAKTYDIEYGELDIGIGLKYITQTSYEGPLSVTDLTGDNPGETLQEEYEKEASGYGIDVGITYKPLPDSSWHPALGLSVLNIGAMDMESNYGGQPLTVNIGASVSPEVKYIDKLVLAADYVDMFNANTVRFYSFGDDGSVSHTDLVDSDFMKRLRLGAGIGLIDSTYFSTTLNVGLYQGAYTAGVDMELTILKLNVATYQEEAGTGSVSIPDRRYMAQIGIGW
ncbi:MAG: conjugal transfer protein TraF [Campylobacterota bacterium]|nr:conjugal transfer protein TraF [Campylobacterota bacterium]